MNIQMMPKRVILALGCAIALTTTLAQGVRADEERSASFYRNALEEYAVKIGKMDQQDTQRATADQLELLRGLVTEGRTLVANERLEALEPVMTRLEKRSRYVSAMLERIELAQQAQQAEQAAAQAEQAAEAKRKEAADLEKRYEQLAGRGL